MKHIVFIESNVTGSGYRAFQKARDLGYRVTFVARDLDVYSHGAGTENLFAACDDVLIAETNDHESLTETLKCHDSAHPVHGVVTFADYYTQAVAHAARSLGLPGADPKAVADAKYKHRARMILRPEGLTPEFAIVGSVDEARREVARIGLPCVVKPVDGAMSGDVRRVDTLEEFESHVALVLSKKFNIRKQPTAGVALAEKVMDGPECSVETLSAGGETHVLGITTKTLEGDPYFAETRLVFPAPVPAEVGDAVKGAALGALRALGLQYGAAHTEIKLTHDGPRIVEVNPRMPGGLVPELIRLSTGVDPMKELLKISVGDAFDLTPLRSGVAGIHFFTVPVAGRLVAVERLDDMRRRPEVAELRIYASTGGQVRPPTSNSDLVGHVIVEGATAEEVEAALDEIRDGLRFVVEPSDQPSLV